MSRIVSLAIFVISASTAGASAAWQGHGGNAQHTALAAPTAQSIAKVHWRTSIDLAPPISANTRHPDYASELLIHYGSPLVTANNTVILGVKTGKNGGYRIEARSSAAGTVLWTLTSGYQPPAHNWFPAYDPVLTPQNRVWFAGEAGVIRFRDTPDSGTGKTGFAAFYGMALYRANGKAYASAVQVSTPLTSDAAGNIYFGFTAAAGTPGGLKSGIARVGADGGGTWISAAAASGDSGIVEVQTNCAPAVSRDGKTIYVGVSTGPNNFGGYLLGLDAKTLAPKYKVRLKEPSNGTNAELSDNSSASPTVGPDGDVYFGVVSGTAATGYHNGRGWLLHFNATLTESKTPGSFGWDDTVSIVPVSMVPSYRGGAPYLVMSKYNNYIGTGTGTGHNEIAILDPDATQFDEYSNTEVKVMKEVLTIAGPTPFPNGKPGQVYEWCVATSAVDPKSGSIYAASEDGNLYRWDLRTNSLAQKLPLGGARGEAYTPTAVGPDGTVYAINNATFFAIGK
jgi:hypothetical protein